MISCQNPKDVPPANTELEKFNYILYELFYLNELYSQQASSIKDSMTQIHFHNLLTESSLTEKQFDSIKVYFESHPSEYEKLLQKFKKQAEASKFQ